VDELRRWAFALEKTDSHWFGSGVSLRAFRRRKLLTLPSVLFYAPFWYAYAAMKKERVAERLSLEDNRRLAYIDYPEKETLLQNA
jgi:cbb3-type cytochrome oxidase subunit 3